MQPIALTYPREGARIEQVRYGTMLLPTGWEDWRPEPGWPVLELPGGWDRVDERTDETT